MTPDGYNVMLSEEEFTALIRLIDDEPTDDAEEAFLKGIRKKLYEKRRMLRRRKGNTHEAQAGGRDLVYQHRSPGRGTASLRPSARKANSA